MTVSACWRRLSLACAALLFVGTTGCLKTQATLVIAKDGSGSLSDSATIDLGKLDAMVEGLLGMLGGGQEGTPTGGLAGGPGGMVKAAKATVDTEAFKKRLEGKTCVTLQSVSSSEDFEKKTATSEFRLKFASLADCLAVGLGSATTINVDLKLEKGTEGSWTLTRKVVLPGGVELPETTSPEAAQQVDMFKMLLQPYLDELSITWNVTVPGKVVSTNGTQNAAGDTVTWKIGFDGLFDRKNLSQTVTFAGEGLSLKPFHVRIDMSGKAQAEDATVVPPTAPKAPDSPKEPAAPKSPEAPKEPAPGGAK